MQRHDTRVVFAVRVCTLVDKHSDYIDISDKRGHSKDASGPALKTKVCSFGQQKAHHLRLTSQQRAKQGGVKRIILGIDIGPFSKEIICNRQISFFRRYVKRRPAVVVLSFCHLWISFNYLPYPEKVAR